MWNLGEKGVTVVDVVIVLVVVALLIFVASREFPLYAPHQPTPPTAAS